ncbi:hypothetical protein [Sphingomonas echinoides]|uniref:hypothetical protein n=1 Tax=Sphingomonas echinoides TaxID=59803 RepID=UPI00241328E9|nr:hypothetical protein [Sphingomonas echinoides]
MPSTPTSLAVLMLLGGATSASASAPPTSWGRSGVSLAQYRTDAVECGRLGANADIAGEPATKAFAAAERFAERNLTMQLSDTELATEQALMVRRLRPEKRLSEVQGVMLNATERCLTRLGYRQFTLTRTQSRRLDRLRVGTPERHAYLHALASDPAVLEAQSIRPGVAPAARSDR